MKILYVGGGFVGACSAAVSADSGHDVLVYDIDKEKVKKLSTDDRDVVNSCINEEGLAELLIRNRTRITFTHDIQLVVNFADSIEVVFMCLPTPEKSGAEGESDLSFYETAVEQIGPFLAKRNHGKQSTRLVIVNKSTVPIRMIDYTEELFSKQGVKNFGIVSNPEFLVEGKAIRGSVRPDRVVIGAKSDEDFKIMRELYQRFYDSSTVKYIEVNPYEAACGKLLANYLLFNKIVNTYDVVGRTCEYFSHVGYEQVRKVLIADPRIGSWGLYNSLFAGGSCFIKDAGSLAHQLEQAGTHGTLIRDVLNANILQRDHFFSRAETEANVDWSGRTVAVLGLAFKQDTNDIRNSGALAIVQQLLGAGVKKIQVYDPVAMDEVKKYFNVKKNELNSRIEYLSSEIQAITGTSVCIICTDWPQFKTLGEIIITIVKTPYLIMDGRRMLQGQFEMLSEKGYDIIAVGSSFIKGKR